MRSFASLRMTAASSHAPGSDLPARQLVDDRLALGVVEHGPAADLVDGALAAEAEAALAVERADADAGRHHAAQRRWPVAHASGLLAELRELVLQLVELAFQVVNGAFAGGLGGIGLGRILPVGHRRRRAGWLAAALPSLAGAVRIEHAHGLLEHRHVLLAHRF